MKRFIKRLDETLDQSFINLAKLDGNYVIKDGEAVATTDVYVLSKSLTTLEGSVEVANHSYYCNSNQLVSLKGGPRWVNKDFLCSNNRLRSLEYGPTHVGGGYSCHHNLLSDLVGMPLKVGGGVDCSTNFLTSLKGCPKEINGDFFVSSNQLDNLIGAPEIINGDFYADYNVNLESFRGLKKVKGNISFVDTNINQNEIDLYKKYRPIFNQWLLSGLELEEYKKTQEYREALMDFNLDRDMKNLWK